MNRLDVSVGKRVRFNGRIREGWWFKPGQSGTVTGFNSDFELPINVLVDGDHNSDEADIAHVHADMIDPIPQDTFSLLEEIKTDIKKLLELAEQKILSDKADKAERDRKSWMRGAGV